jgi:membrane associated rhomboid family serine protease
MAFEDLHRPLGAAGFRGAVRWIILASGAMLILQQMAGGYLVPTLGLVPTAVLERFWLWQPVTYLFLHGGIFHWLFNMFILWMFGRELETRWGTREFVKYFLITGVGAGLCVLALTPNSDAPTIGASGAVFGMLTAFAMVFPEATMYLYFVIPVKAWQAAAIFAFIEFFAALNGGGSGIARFAHLGGMVIGFLYLRFSWGFGVWLKQPWKAVAARWGRPKTSRGRGEVTLHEVTDELVHEVDRILGKISEKGVESLTTEEKQFMDRYSSRLKR